MEYITLNNGIKMPMAGIGVFMMSPAEAEASVESALKSGVRLIDTANGYMNESGTGRGIKKSGVKREDIFLVTKLWPTVYEKETAVDETLSRLGTDYIDLLFLHQPTANWREGYRNIEKAVKAGKVKAIGLSNFPDELLREAIDTMEHFHGRSDAPCAEPFHVRRRKGRSGEFHPLLGAGACGRRRAGQRHCSRCDPHRHLERDQSFR